VMRYGLIIVFVLISSHSFSANLNEKFSYSVSLDVQVNSLSTDAQTWFKNGSGKLKHGSNENNDVAINQLGTQLEYKFDLQSKIRVDAFYQTDNLNKLSITQAFWQFKPLISDNWRARYRVGMFYAPISLENTSQSWLSNHTDSFSVINSWLAEELRTIGIEGIWTWQKSRTAENKFSIIASIFGFNDPAGSKLAWHGWASHNRQTGFGNELALRRLPVFNTGEQFDGQLDGIKPFVELDNRPGYYIGTEWRHKRSVKLQWLYYDNRGDPLTLIDHQYAWDTRFHHLALKIAGANKWALHGQFLSGNMVMGPDAVDNDFKAGYFMLTKALSEKYNLALRLEKFSVDDNDFLLNAIDPNQEDGEAITINLSYQNDSKKLRFYTEAKYLDSRRLSRLLFNEAEEISETSLSLGVRYAF